MVTNLADRLFHGDVKQMVCHLLGLVTAVLQAGTGASYVVELALFAPAAASSRNALAGLPIASSQEPGQIMSVSVTGRPSSTGLRETESDSCENTSAADPSVGYDAIRPLRGNDVEAAVHEMSATIDTDCRVGIGARRATSTRGGSGLRSAHGQSFRDSTKQSFEDMLYQAGAW